MNGEVQMTTAEVATKLRKSTTWVSEAARRGDLPAFKVGGTWRFYESEIDAKLNSPRDPWAKPVRPLRRAS